MRVLVVEDEESLALPLAFLLKKQGYTVDIAPDGPTALELFRSTNPDIILLDVMLPGMSGTKVCREIRKESSVPVIMVTAKDSEVDKITGFELGVDDYVTKPYSARELMARMSAVLRRSQVSAEPATATGTTSSSRHIIDGGRIKIDRLRRVVEVDEEDVDLPNKEYQLLEFLMKHMGEAMERKEIIAAIWGDDYVGDTKTLDVHIKRLRDKLEVDPKKPTVILTVRGVGYRFEAEAEGDPFAP
ncbi:MAG: response regulator transcription factor [Corynebacterium sp.]|nr:response regulator transcription factor [Corynebacterium sp.]